MLFLYQSKNIFSVLLSFLFSEFFLGGGYFVWPKLWSSFFIFSKSKKLTKRGSSKEINHYPSLSIEKVTRDVSVIMKYQQDQMILRALMYCIKETWMAFSKELFSDYVQLIINNIQYLILYKTGVLYFQRYFEHEFSCGNIRKDSFGSVRSSFSQMFFKICHLKNVANFAPKYLCRSLFIIKFQGLG